MSVSLIHSLVSFDPEAHTYHLGKRELQGITGMIGRQLFPDKYKGIDADVLRRAARRGTEIHELCQLYDQCGVLLAEDHIEVANYKQLIEEHGIVTLANEYLVSDEAHFASPIDKVDTNLNLYDIKTTYAKDVEMWGWQLSIYAYLFELQNPTFKAGDLYVIYLRGDKAELVPINRIPSEQIVALMAAEVAGEQYVGQQLTIEQQRLAQMLRIEQTIIEIKEQADYYKSLKEDLSKGIYTEMEKENIKKLDTERMTISRVLPSTRTTFDAKAFEADNKELYDQYLKTTQTKGSLRIKIK